MSLFEAILAFVIFLIVFVRKKTKNKKPASIPEVERGGESHNIS